MLKRTVVIDLSPVERRFLKILFHRGKTSNRQQTRARILDLLDKKIKLATIAGLLNCSPATVYNVKQRYLQEGLAAALKEKERSGKPPQITNEVRARVISLANSPPPAGRTRWTLRLLADKAVELGFIKAISHNSIKEILKKKPF